VAVTLSFSSSVRANVMHQFRSAALEPLLAPDGWPVPFASARRDTPLSGSHGRVSMQIGIIGAGNVGNALGVGWIRAGHDVTFGVRDPNAAPSGGPAGARYASVAAAVRDAEAVVLAVPWPAVADAVAAAGDLSGKLLIDCTNPLRMGVNGLELEIGHTTSGGERVAALASGASVFKTFNQTGFGNMENARAFEPLPAAMYVAGDDVVRKSVVLALVSDLGFEAIDAGPLTVARLLEPMAMLWIHMTLNRGAPMTQAFALTHRD
jgi:8-hydroxy-5-deazaflavin:NADPH oxidoreductase